MKNSKVSSKDSLLFNLFVSLLANDLNLARIRFISHFVCALIATRSVTFSKLASCFGASNDVQADSVYRRIQRFMSQYYLSDKAVAKLVLGLVGNPKAVDLVMDRTDWKIGSYHLNMLALGVRHKGCAIPILFTLLPTKGASHTKVRIGLMEQFLDLYGRERINSLAADREFIGEDWFKYLTANKIKYFIRVKSSTVMTFENGVKVNAKKVFSNLELGSFATRNKPVIVFGVQCYISATRVSAKGGKTDLLLIASFSLDHNPFENYKERWQVETMFKAMKSSGFNINKTHLKKPERIENLFKLVMIAYCWCYQAGIYLHTKVKEITIKSHGRQQVSILKYGIDYLNRKLFMKDNTHILNHLQFLSCT